MTATPIDASSAPKPVYSENYRRLVLFLLVTAYTLNFIDRTIIATLGQPIKDALKISDTQLGLLGGLYFALLYTFLGIPIARFAERFSRVNIITGAILIWSAFTALCGTAGSFVTLAAYRFGVGIGEAGLSPPAHSLISDYFEPKKRASALSIYSFGIPLGTMIGAIASSQIAKAFGWRAAFMVVGLPGVAVAIALKMLVKEPARGHSEADGYVATKPAASLGAEFREMGAVFKLLFGQWPIFNMVMGITLVSFAGYGGGQFVQPYFLRNFHGLDIAAVGLIVGLAAGFSQGIGTLIGGPITDRMSKLSPRWYALVPAIGVALAYPFIVGIYTAASWQIHYAHPGTNGLWDALSGFGASHPADFQAACPGGKAAKTATDAAKAACGGALVLGTRQGVIVAYAFSLWGAFHYLLGSFGLAAALKKARADRGEAD
jgi:predicted MFS family arabinose efflux permease